ncbi:hypothetical protein EIZ47_10725 [Chryseobacterium lacus]|uniref:Uncharacterized protein n=2 Tax=Chryseobacterium lacus TaxID=2058346 RepID=A0A368MVH5_9FLAO|nr:hypothetical protein DQ356_10840 [Chryseobacterium lacus]RST26387.1 hypothetical protein EIZ47_10725 [Chryseobacterium lacus]
MKKILFSALIICFTLTNCAVEKFNMSPLNSTISTGNDSGSLESRLGKAMQNNVNAAEITNLISTFPKFRNDGVNLEVSRLKQHLQNYLYAYGAYDINGKNRNLREIERTYKKIQRLRQYLNKDEDEIINRYLVRLKTNLSELESASAQAP